MIPILQADTTNFLSRSCSCSMICSVVSQCNCKKLSSVCTVHAVHTPNPYTPCCSKVLQSASTPAPPLGSKPEIDNTYGRGGCINCVYSQQAGTPLLFYFVII